MATRIPHHFWQNPSHSKINGLVWRRALHLQIQRSHLLASSLDFRVIIDQKPSGAICIGTHIQLCFTQLLSRWSRQNGLACRRRKGIGSQPCDCLREFWRHPTIRFQAQSEARRKILLGFALRLSIDHARRFTTSLVASIARTKTHTRTPHQPYFPKHSSDRSKLVPFNSRHSNSFSLFCHYVSKIGVTGCSIHVLDKQNLAKCSWGCAWKYDWRSVKHVDHKPQH